MEIQKTDRVYVLCEEPRWNEEKFMHGVYASKQTLAEAMNIVMDNHELKGLAPPDFGIETVKLDEMPFDWVAYKKG
jgi:hypothetical protein